LDVLRWFGDWSHGGRTLGAGRLVLNILKSALGFGTVCGYSDCARLRGMLSALRFPSPKPREFAPSLDDVRRAMTAAKALGCPRAALAYAIQLDCAIRPTDLTGQWFPLSDPRPSPVFTGTLKWLGPSWSVIDKDLIMTITPSKTSGTTGKRVMVDLKLCPLVMAELATIPLEARSGPLIIDDRTGKPFCRHGFLRLWRRVRVAAGLPPQLWNRDLRAGSLTEASMAGASSDDRAKLAAHSRKVTQQVYDRDTLVSSSRVAEARAKYREQNKEK
jgi:hypothetical protein